MSQSVIFDLSNAAARSKGQAIRRQHPNLSSEARKAHRKATRQKRTELKKQGSIEPQIREEQSQEASLAPLARMEMTSDSIVKGSVQNGHSNHDHDATSRVGCSAFTMFPRFQGMTNKRALGQANRYMNANARKRTQQDTGGRPEMKSGESSADGRDCDSKSPIAEPVDEDGKLAETTALTLMNISKGAAPSVPSEQPTEIYLSQFEENDLEHLSTVKPIEPVCEDSTKGFAPKACRDSCIANRHDCTMTCDFCHNIFEGVGALKDHVVFTHFWEHGLEITCRTCNRGGINPERFYKHVENCVLR